MSAPNSKDFFSSFLQAADASHAKEAADAPPEAVGVEREVLKFLLTREGPISVKELLVTLSVPPSLAMEALKRLSDAKLVDYHRIESDDCVMLSDLGRRVSS